MGDLGLVDDAAKLARPQHRHGVDHHGADLGRRQPAGDHGRVVGRADQHPVAGFDLQIFDQRMGQPVGPVAKFLVGALPPVADQGRAVAKSLFHHRIGQFDGGIQPFGIGESVQKQIGPSVHCWKVVTCERVLVGRGSKHVILPQRRPVSGGRSPRAERLKPPRRCAGRGFPYRAFRRSRRISPRHRRAIALPCR